MLFYGRNFGPHYVKREDAVGFVRSTRRRIGMVLGAFVVVVGLMSFFVVPNLRELYKDFGTEMPWMVENFMMVSVVLMVGLFGGAGFLSFMEPDYHALEQRLSELKDGEMVNSRELIDDRWERGALIVMGFVVGFLVYSVIVPIYSLTSSL